MSKVNDEDKSYNNSGNKKVKLSTIIIIVVVLFIAIIFGYDFISYIMDMPQKYEENKYKKEISEYLEEKYNEEFDITFLYKANEAIPIWEDTYIGCCFNNNKIGYVYTFSPKKNDDIYCYIVYWQDTQKNTNGIEELTDLSKYPQDSSELFKYSKIKYTYEESLKYYNEKQEIKDKLEQYLGGNYNIDLYTDAKQIVVIPKGEERYEDISKTDEFNDLYKNLINLFNDKDIELSLEYWDETLILNSTYLRVFNEKQEIRNKLIEYLGNNYKIDLYSRQRLIIVNTDMKVEEAISDEMYENLATLFYNKNIELSINCLNSTISIDNDSLECYNEKKEIKDLLREYLGNNYTIDLYSTNYRIVAKAYLSYEQIMMTDEFEKLYTDISKLLKNRNIEMVLKYADKEITIYRKQDNIEPKIEIKNKLKQFLEDDYKIDIYSGYGSIIIKTNKTFENITYNDSNNFIELYNNIIDALQGNSIWINLQCRDKYIHIYEKTFKITDIDDIEIRGEVYNVTGENYDN